MAYNPWAFAVISALYLVCASLFRRKRVPSIPLAGCDGISAKVSFLHNTRSWLEKGQKDVRNPRQLWYFSTRAQSEMQYAGRVFRLWTPDGYLHIASSAHLKELNSLGDDHLRVAFTDNVRLCASKGFEKVDTVELTKTLVDGPIHRHVIVLRLAAISNPS